MRAEATRRAALWLRIFIVLAVGVIGALWATRLPPPPERAGAVGKAMCQWAVPPGMPGRTDGNTTEDGLHFVVDAPTDYDPTQGYPLLVVFPPAGHTRHSAEGYYDITRQATRAGFVVAFSDHLPLSRAAIAQQAKVAEAVAEGWCIDPREVAFLGHSDGGTVAEGVALMHGQSRLPPRAIIASAAGMLRSDLEAEGCPAPLDVVIVHNPADELFPDYGRDAAAFWAGCMGCAVETSASDVAGCRDYHGCANGQRVRYCEVSTGHANFPDIISSVLDFFGRDRNRASSPADSVR
jgi:polyhydroxybutyrate depolymerase